jgi:hypothetical protein
VIGDPTVASGGAVPLVVLSGRGVLGWAGPGRGGQGEDGEERGFEFAGRGQGLQDFNLPFALAADQPRVVCRMR